MLYWYRFWIQAPTTNLISGDNSPKSNSTSPPNTYGGFESHSSEQLRSPADSDLMTPISIPSSIPPTTPHSIQHMHWNNEGAGSHHSPHVNTYFPNTEIYAKTVGGYDVVS